MKTYSHQLNRFNIRLSSLAVRGLVCAVLAYLLLTWQASAAFFSFSTGTPDGKIATLARVGTAAGIQTETADDFLLTENTAIYQATFTGLIPFGASVRQVEVEIYHVFPADSDTNRLITVPTRQNSPGDVEIDEATRDSADGSITFNAVVNSNSGNAANSVATNLHVAAGGEGAVTGQEVSIGLTFNPPIALPAGHYFFRPEVLLDNGDFLWLSAAKPIVDPGTPFLPDLQTWIRNDNLAPDWLRIGTDIVGGAAFNAVFALLGESDADLDGVGDSQDQCPNTPPGSIVDAHGCSIDQLAPCAGPASGGTWRNHGEYVSNVARAVGDFFDQGLLTEEEADAIVSAAAQSSCGFRSR